MHQSKFLVIEGIHEIKHESIFLGIKSMLLVIKSMHENTDEAMRKLLQALFG